MSSLVHHTLQRVPARAYCGMWIVDCERCRNAEQLDRLQPAIMCSYCEASIEVVWPAEEMVYSIERLLLMRPILHTQNWMPGETLHDLTWENAEHGVLTVTPEILDGLGSTPLIVEDGKIRTDKLPMTRRREFKAIEIK